MRPVPTHHDFQINDRVKFTLENDEKLHRGTIRGVAAMHIVFTYIIELEEPIQVPGWNAPWKCISLFGGALTLA